MTTGYCCECGRECSISNSFRHRIMNENNLAWWCFECANNQLKVIGKKSWT